MTRKLKKNILINEACNNFKIEIKNLTKMINDTKSKETENFLSNTLTVFCRFMGRINLSLNLLNLCKITK